MRSEKRFLKITRKYVKRLIKASTVISSRCLGLKDCFEPHCITFPLICRVRNTAASVPCVTTVRELVLGPVWMQLQSLGTSTICCHPQIGCKVIWQQTAACVACFAICLCPGCVTADSSQRQASSVGQPSIVVYHTGSGGRISSDT